MDRQILQHISAHENVETTIKLNDKDTYYKCDQWDGLLSLIKDKLGKYSGSGYDMDREYRAYKFKG